MVLRIFQLRALLAVFSLLTGCATTGPATGGFLAYRHPLFHRSPNAYHSSAGSKAARLKIGVHKMPICTTHFRHPLLNQCRPRLPGQEPIPGRRAARAAQFDDPIALRLSVAQRARSMLRHQDGLIGETRYRRDCSGFVLAVFAGAKVRIEEVLDTGGRSPSVAELYRLAEKRGLVHHHNVPAIGDLVFFDNTYDRNHDGIPNDPLTHVGIVESVAPDGTITFVHRVRRGVLRYKMNRFKPHARRDGATRQVLNHYLKTGSPSKPGKQLTGELFSAFATIVR